jgi:hypothetical protein
MGIVYTIDTVQQGPVTGPIEVPVTEMFIESINKEIVPLENVLKSTL